MQRHWLPGAERAGSARRISAGLMAGRQPQALRCSEGFLIRRRTCKRFADPRISGTTGRPKKDLGQANRQDPFSTGMYRGKTRNARERSIDPDQQWTHRSWLTSKSSER